MPKWRLSLIYSTYMCPSLSLAEIDSSRYLCLPAHWCWHLQVYRWLAKMNTFHIFQRWEHSIDISGNSSKQFWSNPKSIWKLWGIPRWRNSDRRVSIVGQLKVVEVCGIEMNGSYPLKSGVKALVWIVKNKTERKAWWG